MRPGRPTGRGSRHCQHGNPSGWSDWVVLGALGVGAAPWGGPLVPAGFGLGDVPAARLLDPVAFAAPGAGVAATGSAALVVGDRMLEVAVAGVAGAGRERAGVVADLDKVAEGGVGLVGVRLVAVVTVVGRDRRDVQGALQARWDGQRPGAAPVRVAWIALAP